MRRAALTQSDRNRARDLADAWRRQIRGAAPQASNRCISLPQQIRGEVHAIEQDAIVTALKQAMGNKAKAARLLGIDYKTYRTKLRCWGQIEGPSMTEAQSLSPLDAGAATPIFDGREAICLFAFAQSGNARERPGEAVDERLMLHRVGSIAALIGVVPIAEYCGPEGERNLADAVWIAPRVRRHAELVEWTMQWSPVFPIPFGTLYKSFDSLTAFMRAHEETIAGFLQSVADKEEWELRLAPSLTTRKSSTGWLATRGLNGGGCRRVCDICAPVGTATRCWMSAGANAAALVRDFVAELQPLTASVRELDPGRRLDPGAGEPIARYAFLVASSNAAEIRARVGEIAISASRQNVAISCWDLGLRSVFGRT